VQISDFLEQTGGAQSLARELGLSTSQVQSGAAALLPSILGGFSRQAAAQPSGAAGLGSLLEQMGGGGLLDNVLSPQPTDVNRGNTVLGEIFGGKDVSRAVADNAAGQTGLDASVLRKMLPLLAMLAAGYMARERSGAGAGAARSGGGGLGGLLGQVLGGGGGQGPLGSLGGLVGGRGGGNPLEDILRGLGR